VKANELLKILETVDPNAEVILVAYTKNDCECGYVERVDTTVKYNSVTKERLEDDESVVELTTQTGVK
jgi:hypothetical protein